MNEILKSFAPALATALGGPLAGAAVSFLADKLGASEKTKEGIQNVLMGMTAQDLVKLREIDYQFQQAMAENSIKIQLAQIDANKEEAKSPNLFIAGWRPAVGWIGAISLGLVYIPKAVVLTAFWCYQAYMALNAGGVLPSFPDLGVTDLLGLLGSILGIGAFRSWEKVNNSEGNRS